MSEIYSVDLMRDMAAAFEAEPNDAPRFTAGSTLRSIAVGADNLLPPPQAVVNTTPVQMIVHDHMPFPRTSDEPAPEPVDDEEAR